MELRGSALLLFAAPHPDPSRPPQPSPSGRAPDVVARLGGGSVRISGAAGFVVRDSGGGRLSFKLPGPEARTAWLLALRGVRGLARRAGDFYALGPVVGEGATCKVHDARCRLTGARVALKTRLDPTSDGALRALHNEIKTLELCNAAPHPVIPRLLDHFFDPSGNLHMVSEFMDGGEVFTRIVQRGHLDEEEARGIFRQVVEGVAHLHAMHIAHRDLKPENLMFKVVACGADACPGGEGAAGSPRRRCDGAAGRGAGGGPDGPDPRGSSETARHDDGRAGGAQCRHGSREQVMIVDFDLARLDNSSHWEGDTPCGTLSYMAPEIVSRRRYSQSVDMWSLGCILYILLSGRKPFGGGTEEARKENIRQARVCLHPKLFEGVSESAQDLIRALLVKNPAHRLTAAEVLRHRWLSETAGTRLATPHVIKSALSPLALGGLLGGWRSARSAHGSYGETHHATRKELYSNRVIGNIGNDAVRHREDPHPDDRRHAAAGAGPGGGGAGHALEPTVTNLFGLVPMLSGYWMGDSAAVAHMVWGGGGGEGGGASTSSSAGTAPPPAPPARPIGPARGAGGPPGSGPGLPGPWGSGSAGAGSSAGSDGPAPDGQASSPSRLRLPRLRGWPGRRSKEASAENAALERFRMQVELGGGPPLETGHRVSIDRPACAGRTPRPSAFES